MKILYVICNLYTRGNGLSASVRQTMERMEERGYEVRVLSGRDHAGEQFPDYPLEDFKLPVFDPIVEKQGYLFAKSDTDIIHRAVDWADVIHLEEPFPLESKVAEYAGEKGVPCVGTYHMHPENLFASVRLGKSRLLGNGMLLLWRNSVFDQCAIVTCPTKNVSDRLERWNFKSELRVISNGIPEEEEALDHPGSLRQKNEYNVITVGRFSNEKNQITLLKAMRYSRFRDKIHLYFAGRGPIEDKLRRYADKLFREGVLRYPVSFAYYAHEDLQELYAKADLYVHCATVEVEGMSCMEAFQSGIVPVISEGRLSGTSQFALNENSIFAEGDPGDLAAKIDYWLSHEEERRREAEKYKEMGRAYPLSRSIDQMEAVYRDAVAMQECREK
ncbi:MAG: glycosyltransferase [Clostridiales bacterium]|nr:glycosyltransferase [Clostridiales bacterium]